MTRWRENSSLSMTRKTVSSVCSPSSTSPVSTKTNSLRHMSLLSNSPTFPNTQICSTSDRNMWTWERSRLWCSNQSVQSTYSSGSNSARPSSVCPDCCSSSAKSPVQWLTCMSMDWCTATSIPLDCTGVMGGQCLTWLACHTILLSCWKARTLQVISLSQRQRWFKKCPTMTLWWVWTTKWVQLLMCGHLAVVFTI